MINKYNLIFLLAIALLSCSNSQSKDNRFIKIVQENNHFGYQIYHDDRLLINQPYIPAINGEIAFKDSAEARKVAQLVLRKLDKTKFPRITIQELDSLRISYK